MQTSQDMFDKLLKNIKESYGGIHSSKLQTPNAIYTFKDGVFHSFNDEPAVNYISGLKGWFENGKLSRKDGCAVSSTNLREWWEDGKLHRTEKNSDGKTMPAIIFSQGESSYEAWYINGLLSRDWKEGPAYKDKFCEKYYSNGKLNRLDDKPAVVSTDSCEREWWVFGQRHRENGLPAIIKLDGTKEFWFLNKKY